MSDTLYPSSIGALSEALKRHTPEPHDAFQTFSRRVFANGALTSKTKQLIAVAVAVAHVTQRPYCTPKPRCARARRRCLYAFGADFERNEEAAPSLISKDAIAKIAID